jgi:hypothetical protein
VREIIRLIDWMMHLRIDLDQRLQQQLNELEEDRNMPYVTSFERLAEARGKADAYLLQLEEICGAVPEAAQLRIRELTNDQFKKLGKELLRFKSLGDLERWLEQNAGTEASPSGEE